MANTVRTYLLESLRGFYERLPFKQGMTYITYAELKNLRDTSSLVPGMQYRITDYHCSTTQMDTSTADNQFDIIVTADSSTILNENARAAKHTDSSTDYFAKCNLEAWELKYCLDNDKERFAWAKEFKSPISHEDVFIFKQGNSYRSWVRYPSLDSSSGYAWMYSDMGSDSITDWMESVINYNDEFLEDHSVVYTNSPHPSIGYVFSDLLQTAIITETSWGQGVVYYMKDEWNNECPYDFKNIMFLRGQDWREEHADISQTIFGDCEEEYFYTFSCYDTENLQLGDATLKNCDGVIHDTEECSCFCNTIKILRGPSGVGQDSGNLPAYLNNIVFFNTYETDVYYTCFSNVFETDCFDNTFGSGCHANSFENGCNSNFFGSCGSNSFGRSCYYNSFEGSCNYNSFGNNCYSNTFGNEYSYNSFGNNCYSNTFGSNCYSNTFGNNCYSNSFGSNCESNSFESDCHHIKFGDSLSAKSKYKYIIVENGNQHIYLDTTQTTSSSNWIQNIKIAQGVNNTTTWKTITHNTANDTFQTVYQPANSQTISV